MPAGLALVLGEGFVAVTRLPVPLTDAPEEHRVDLGPAALYGDDDDALAPAQPFPPLPPGVRVFMFRGPLFFGAASAISATRAAK